MGWDFPGVARSASKHLTRPDVEKGFPASPFIQDRRAIVLIPTPARASQREWRPSGAASRLSRIIRQSGQVSHSPGLRTLSSTFRRDAAARSAAIGSSIS